MFTKEDRWSYIKQLYANQEYEICLNELEKFFEELKINLDDFYLWRVKFQVALCLKKIGRVKQAVSCAKSSLQYAITASDKTQVFWFLGCYYESIDKQESLKYFHRAALNYENLKLYDYMYALRFNMAKVLCQYKEMETNLDLLKQAKNNLYRIDKIKFDAMVNQGTIELFTFYIERNMTSLAIRLLHKTLDKNIRKTMITIMQKSEVLVCVM
jgi:tetratricopeptide (TPR) repeat protein